MDSHRKIGSKKGKYRPICRKKEKHSTANLFQCLSDEIEQKRLHLAKKNVLFHQDNVPAHTYVIEMAKINTFKTAVPQFGDAINQLFFSRVK